MGKFLKSSWKEVGKVLHYTEFGISHTEVPGEVALCIYISGCQNRCMECHYPELQRTDYGELVSEYFEQILDLYHEYTTCVCFMGEGEESEIVRRELLACVQESHNRGYTCCLYSGRDVEIEEWMKVFDYVKIGSYQKDRGALCERTTNQQMWKRMNNGSYEDITYQFWNED